MEKQRKKAFRSFGMVMFLWAINLSAQGPDTLWTRTYGGDSIDGGWSVQQTSDGGYIIAGCTYSFGPGRSAYLIKTDAAGNTLWMRTYGGTEGCSVRQTSDGGYIIAGSKWSGDTGLSDVYLIKTDTKGDTLWTRTYGGKDEDFGYSIQETSDGGYIIVGYTRSFGAGWNDIYLIRTDEKGDTLWTRTYGGTDSDMGYSVQQTSDGGYIIAGSTTSFGAGNVDVYLIKTDANGDTLWTKTYGGTENDIGYSAQQTSAEGYIIAGYTGSLSYARADVYLIKTDINGDTLWTRTYGGTWNDVGFSIQETPDGGYIIAGAICSLYAGRDNVYLIKTDINGDTLWTRTYGGADHDYSRSVQQTSDGGYIVVGGTFSFGAGESDVYLIKTKPLLRLTSPNGGEVLVSNTIHHITWYPEGTYFDSYRLLYSLDGGESYPHIIADRISPNSGIYSWRVPEIDCNTCRVKAQIRNMESKVIKEDESDSNFTIQTTGIEEEESLPKTFFVYLIEPNSFRQKTTIRYTIPDAEYKPQDFSLMIYDISGRVVRDLTNDLVSCIKNHVSTVSWDGRDNSGEKVSSGIYFLRFEAYPVRPLISYGAERYKATRKLLIIKK